MSRSKGGNNSFAELRVFDVKGSDVTTSVTTLISGTSCKVVIYPNPLIDQDLSVSFAQFGLTDLALVGITDISGRIIYNQLIQPFGVQKIDRSHFKRGIYLVKIKSDLPFNDVFKLIVN
jgi:hypothetical protein